MGDELQSLVAHPVAPTTIGEVSSFVKDNVADGTKGLKQSLAQHNEQLQARESNYLNLAENARIRLVDFTCTLEAWL